MRSWYEIKAKAAAVDVFIYDEIGLFGIPASQFVNDLQGLKGKQLNVFINSPGGEVWDGMAIYTALSRHNAPVNVVVDGLAASVASVIAQAGSTRTMAPASVMMVHEAWGIAQGPTPEMEKMIEQLQVVDEQIANVYAAKAGGTPQEWRKVMAAETWYKAQDAVDAGLADKIADAPPVAAAYAGRIFNLSKFEKVPDFVPQKDDPDPENDDENVNPPAEPGEPENTEDEMDPTIRQALGLDDQADDNAILAAINKLKDDAKDIATGEKGVENQLRKDLATAQQQILSIESDYGQRILTLEQRNRTKEAEYAVNTAIAEGRVQPKDKDIAMKLALNDSEAFAQFASGLRVDLNERGMASDLQMAELEPTHDEMKQAAQLGLTREDLIKQKAADRGIALPA